jgi:hypothetical protein
MALDIYGTATLMGVVRTVRPSAPGFWLNLFGRQFTFDTEEVDFDEVMVDRRIAPLVMPTVAGVPQRDRAITIRKYKPAYIKPLHTLNPRRTLERQAGEGFGGTMSPEQRAAALIGQYVQDQRDMIERRWEWMAARAVLDGSITLSSPTYPAATISFGRAAGHTVTLGSGSRWGESGIKALNNIETWATTVFQASGYPVTNVIMGTEAWAAFSADAEVRDLLKTFRGADKLGGLDIVPGSGTNIQYKGTDGSRDYWVYNDFYDADDGTATAMMSAKDVLLVNPAGLAGAKAFGAILDMDSLQAVPIFTKSYTENNPSARFILSQSAPLMIPGRPNASLKATVVA